MVVVVVAEAADASVKVVAEAAEASVKISELAEGIADTVVVPEPAVQ